MLVMTCSSFHVLGWTDVDDMIHRRTLYNFNSCRRLLNQTAATVSCPPPPSRLDPTNSLRFQITSKALDVRTTRVAVEDDGEPFPLWFPRTEHNDMVNATKTDIIIDRRQVLQQ